MSLRFRPDPAFWGSPLSGAPALPPEWRALSFAQIGYATFLLTKDRPSLTLEEALSLGQEEGLSSREAEQTLWAVQQWCQSKNAVPLDEAARGTHPVLSDTGFFKDRESGFQLIRESKNHWVLKEHREAPLKRYVCTAHTAHWETLFEKAQGLPGAALFESSVIIEEEPAWENPPVELTHWIQDSAVWANFKDAMGFSAHVVINESARDSFVQPMMPAEENLFGAPSPKRKPKKADQAAEHEDDTEHEDAAQDTEHDTENEDAAQDTEHDTKNEANKAQEDEGVPRKAAGFPPCVHDEPAPPEGWGVPESELPEDDLTYRLPLSETIVCENPIEDPEGDKAWEMVAPTAPAQEAPLETPSEAGDRAPETQKEETVEAPGPSAGVLSDLFGEAVPPPSEKKRTSKKQGWAPPSTGVLTLTDEDDLPHPELVSCKVMLKEGVFPAPGPLMVARLKRCWVLDETALLLVIRQALVWLEQCAPSQRKTRAGFERFLSKWVTREAQKIHASRLRRPVLMTDPEGLECKAPPLPHEKKPSVRDVINRQAQRFKDWQQKEHEAWMQDD
jgi:hypothetical protein